MYDIVELRRYFEDAVKIRGKHPVPVDQLLEDAVEFAVKPARHHTRCISTISPNIESEPDAIAQPRKVFAGNDQVGQSQTPGQCLQLENRCR